MHAAVSVCNNSASLIGLCGFPITPPDLHKSNGPLVNPDPAAHSRHTPGPNTPHSKTQKKKKQKTPRSYTLNTVSVCAAALQQSPTEPQAASSKETTVRTMNSWSVSASFTLTLDLKDTSQTTYVTRVPQKAANLDIKARAQEGGCCVQQHTPLLGDGSFQLCF